MRWPYPVHVVIVLAFSCDAAAVVQSDDTCFMQKDMTLTRSSEPISLHKAARNSLASSEDEVLELSSDRTAVNVSLAEHEGYHGSGTNSSSFVGQVSFTSQLENKRIRSAGVFHSAADEDTSATTSNSALETTLETAAAVVGSVIQETAAAVVGKGSSSEPDEKWVKHRFKSLDTNKDGSIGFKEFKVWAKQKVGSYVGKGKDVRESFHVLDQDSDGAVSFKEFQQKVDEARAQDARVKTEVKWGLVVVIIGVCLIGVFGIIMVTWHCCDILGWRMIHRGHSRS